MKNVRVFYKKKSRLKFISHLDMNRFMTRIIRKTDIPIWYTEGFNCHAYITFALPLSLGFESEYDIMDFKITDDNYPFRLVKDELTRVMPHDLEIVNVCEPVLKTGKIAFAEFRVFFNTINDEIKENVIKFISRSEILCSKKNKKGNDITVNIAPKIKSYKFNDNILLLTLSAGNENLNPVFLLTAIEDNLQINLPFYEITRTAIYDENLKLFK